MMKLIPFTLFLLACFTGMSTTVTVTSTADSGPGTLREAVDNSVDGDTILFDASTNTIPIVLTSGLTVNTKLTIIGNDSTNTILSGNNSNRIMLVSDTVYVANLRLQEGSLLSWNAVMGAAIGVETTGVLTVESCDIINNIALYGAGIHCVNNAHAYIYNSRFYRNHSDNNSTYGGAAFSATFTLGSEFIIENTLFEENTLVQDNPNDRSGAAIFLFSGDLTLNNCEFKNNATTALVDRGALGGAIFIRAFNTYTANVKVNDCKFNGNSCVAENVSKSALGAGIYARGPIDLVIKRSEFSNNSVYADSSTASGAAVYAYIDSLYIEDSWFSGNTSEANANVSVVNGGALFIYTANPTIQRCTFENNTATANTNSANGGAIYMATIVDTIRMLNSTFYGNQSISTTNALGGAISDNASYNLYINNTIVDNSCIAPGQTRAGGVGFFKSFNNRNVFNNIIANNFTTSSNSVDLYWESTSTFQISGNLVENIFPHSVAFDYTSDPGLDPSGPAHHGGLTRTIAITNPASEAIDNADVTYAPTFDQRGAIRSGAPDIGAYEYMGCVESSSSQTLTSCTSYTSPSGNYTWTMDGVYMDTISNALGCDSVMTFDLTIIYPSASTMSVTTCDNYTVPSGDENYTASGTYMDTIPNAMGCDSVMTINLTILNSSTSAITVTECNSYTVPSGDETYGMSGTYTDTLTNVVGCDSVITINLTINYNSFSTYTVTACDSYNVPSGDETYTTSGFYMDTIPNTVGCDSVMTINLTILNSTASSMNVTECDAYTVPSGDETYTISGNYTDTLVNSVGCDSLITINLTILNSTTSTLTVTECNSYTVPSGDETYGMSGTYMDTLTNAAGCDSVITINLTINYTSMSSFSMTTCDSYTVPSGDETYTTSGTYMDTIPSMVGCDSVMTINLTILNSSTSAITITECNSYTVPSGDETYTTSGMYIDTIPNIAGCDSVITINLNIIQSSTGTDIITACDSYTWIDGNTYTTSNSNATFMMINAAGCDSLISLSLTILNTTNSNITVSECGSVYTVPSGDETYTASGTYMDTIPNSAGCDSVITINLTMVQLDTSVSVTGIQLSANASGMNYQWLDCTNGHAIITGETSQSFTPIANGSYALEINDGSCTDTSMCHTINTVDITEHQRFEVKLYPNPSTGIINIQLENLIDNTTVQVLNTLGQVIYTGQLNSKTNTLDINGVEKGHYFVRIINDKEIFVESIIIE